MIEIVVIHLVAMFCVLHGKIVARTDKEKVPNNISNHLLVQITIIYMFPVCILNIWFIKLSNLFLFTTWNIIASFSSCETGHCEPKMDSMISRKAARGRKLGLSFLKYSIKS